MRRLHKQRPEHPSRLAEQLRRKREGWARKLAAPGWGAGWRGLSAALSFAERRLARSVSFSALAGGSQALAWPTQQMEFLPLLEQLQLLFGLRVREQEESRRGQSGRALAVASPRASKQTMGEKLLRLEQPSLPSSLNFPPSLLLRLMLSEQIFQAPFFRQQLSLRRASAGERASGPQPLLAPAETERLRQTSRQSFSTSEAHRLLSGAQPPPGSRQAGGGPTLAEESAASLFERTRLVFHQTTGIALEPSLRSHLEQRMGFDLGGVRIHADSGAASLASHLQAHAFTVGPHIFFAAGRFRPATRAGLSLLAHELTHVRQQPLGAPFGWQQLTPTQHRSLEAEAQHAAHAALAGPAQPAFRGGHPGEQGAASRSDGTQLLFVAAPQQKGDSFPPLVMSWPSRTMAVTPLREASTSALPEAPAAKISSPDAGGNSAAGAHPNAEQLAQQVLALIGRRLRIERERGGVQRWH